MAQEHTYAALNEFVIEYINNPSTDCISYKQSPKHRAAEVLELMVTHLWCHSDANRNDAFVDCYIEASLLKAKIMEIAKQQVSKQKAQEAQEASA